MKVQRITTGHSAQGKAIFVSDTEVDGARVSLMPGAEFHKLWGANLAPAFADAGLQPPGSGYFPPLGATAS